MATLTTWRFVAWHSSDPLNVETPPTPIAGTVKARGRTDAFNKAMELLASTNGHGEILNWYVEKIG